MVAYQQQRHCQESSREATDEEANDRLMLKLELMDEERAILCSQINLFKKQVEDLKASYSNDEWMADADNDLLKLASEFNMMVNTYDKHLKDLNDSFKQFTQRREAIQGKGTSQSQGFSDVERS
ncbi:hypothetical protein BT96DRAFT_951403 [Gymnopus androsaceus JB14]|uniref:Uncharacterized protein n=1 Tax=Gymnopus androsaceus JB14 TaxID=1447944 RepID=A0A6A4GD72_9AGAR|nr:hypothetical protein BT96DRAFT_951403 [Gymnopus androsaceus JB14]